MRKAQLMIVRLVLAILRLEQARIPNARPLW
ncbi:hypothetical protein FHS74_002262 [Nitrospirillum iridis]|uniref:Uncharacterized protein n=1 Tax=Nitrospirillum iridis TaxID=765888 RepID=A0A7X0AYL1_9PROT|nr:hypothetical protein [Nitrospirillum iridis]